MPIDNTDIICLIFCGLLNQIFINYNWGIQLCYVISDLSLFINYPIFRYCHYRHKRWLKILVRCNQNDTMGHDVIRKL